MVRSLYSGVAGMTTHQTKMDVIGNNISNVSTYGYKASRATFRDVYYQTTQAASSATALRGGTNATQVGYGTSLGSIDVNHAQSIMTTTGFSLDVAITGEGYLQVQDAEGNIYYTKAGMLDIDGEGNLVDVNGNFVLGVSGDTTGQLPSSERIKINLPYENPEYATASEIINEVGIDITSSNQSSLSNVALAFQISSQLPYGQKAQAVVSSSAITVTLNQYETFDDVQEFQDAVNEAIKAANSGAEHPAGELNFSFDNDIFGTTGLTAEQLINSNTGVDLGTVEVTADTGTAGTEDDITNYFSILTVGDEFSASGTGMSFALTDEAAESASGEDEYTITVGNYSAVLTASQMSASGSVLLKRTGVADSDSITVSFPKLTKFPSEVIDGSEPLEGDVTMTASAPSRDVGLGSVKFILEGGTEGGAQSAADLTSISVGQDGVITAIHPTLGELELGRIDLATFENPKGLTQVGNTYFAESVNSGEPQLAIPGTEGTGALASGTLETSNVDLSKEFSDMITTQRGFQANSRIITVSDTMLEELINLKR